MAKINLQNINNHTAYTIKELAEKEKLDRDPKTFSRWIDAGLKIVPGCKHPILILGSDLREFDNKRRRKNKFSRKCKENELPCFSCEEPRKPKRGTIITKEGYKTALCSVCNSRMSRTLKPP